MTWDEVKTNWEEVRERAKEAWPRLHSAELDVIDGDRERLIDKVRDAQSMSHDAAVDEVEAWRRNLP